MIGTCTGLVKKEGTAFAPSYLYALRLSHCVSQGLYLLSLLGKMGIMVPDRSQDWKCEAENTMLSKAWSLILKASILSPGPRQRA